MNFLTDSHAHLTSSSLYDQVDYYLEKAQEANVKQIINICTDRLSLERGLELSKKYPWVHQVASTTPHDVEKEGEDVFGFVAEQARAGKLKAIGETGLDYYYSYSNPAIQKDFLIRYLKLALECGLPLVIHCREAFADLFSIIDEYYRLSDGSWAPGVLHCFTGSVEEAYEVIKRGWMLSISGIVTFKKSTILQSVARLVPDHLLLIETDCPYLAPVPYRGKDNQPSFLSATASFVADLRQTTLNHIQEITSTNAKNFFKI